MTVTTLATGTVIATLRVELPSEEFQLMIRNLTFFAMIQYKSFLNRIIIL